MTITVRKINVQKNNITLIILLCIILASITLPIDFHIKLLPCFFKNTFDIPCPGCGMTRAFILIGHFRFQQALAMNSNSIFSYILMLTITINESASFVTGRKIYFRLSGLETVLIFFVVLCLVWTAWYCNLINGQI